MDNVDVAEVHVVENEARVEVVNDQPVGFAEPSTIGSATVDQSSAFEDASGVDDHGNTQFENATGLEDPVDTQFEQPTFEGAMGLEDPIAHSSSNSRLRVQQDWKILEMHLLNPLLKKPLMLRILTLGLLVVNQRWKERIMILAWKISPILNTNKMMWKRTTKSKTYFSD
ncbi:Hypothetical predicted protein [Olea europaea subsp. europaea]|uniref:Uncharacterized protein n=1 Tax=Olea europaea subsp. europaea TaxID=158383 RepID=A0A8S0T3J8_OLEEU|nr:Hypothetical predicted protein [Olea europaea subsp. europaea]